MKHYSIATLAALLLGCSLQARGPITPNDFKGSDTRRIQAAVDAAAGKGVNSVTIPRSNSNGTAVWMIDSAILLPSGMTVILDDCTMQLSDECRDNMFRSNNVGAGITDPEWNKDISIIGTGKATIRGASNPRATGDGLRHLSLNPEPNYNKDRSSYGTDAGRPEMKQTSDWRGFLVLMAYVDGVTIKGLKVEYAHTWALTFEKVHNAHISDLEIFCPQYRYVDGKRVHTFNNDGIDLREGCKYFWIENINAVTGDDCIALSALDMGPKYHGNGLLDSFQVTSCAHNGPEDDIEYVYITNVHTNYAGVALRTSDSACIHHVFINGLTVSKNPQYTTPYKGSPYTLLVGNTGYGAAGGAYQIHDVYATNIVGDGRELILVKNPIKDCVFMNCIYYGQTAPWPISYRKDCREKSRNVSEVNVIRQPSAADNSVPQ